MNPIVEKYNKFKRSLILSDSLIEEYPEVNNAVENQIIWWLNNKIAPEDITIKEYSNLSEKQKKVLLEALKLPRKFIQHTTSQDLVFIQKTVL